MIDSVAMMVVMTEMIMMAILLSNQCWCSSLSWSSGHDHWSISSNFDHPHQPCPGPLVEYPTSRACRVVALSTGEVVQQVVTIMMMMTMVTSADSEVKMDSQVKVSESLWQALKLSVRNSVKRLYQVTLQKDCKYNMNISMNKTLNNYFEFVPS